jgi:SAM-dependent methyltransferase
MGLRERIKNLPHVGLVATRLYRRLKGTRQVFPGSSRYWEDRYRRGRDSGVGSYGKFAEFKANILNRFVSQHGISSVIEFGCGDGNQLALASYPRYLGFDVSETAISLCRARFAGDSGRDFKLMRDYECETAELCLSLDVLLHLVEDDVYELYMARLFGSSERYVIIYSSNTNRLDPSQPHVRHRKFTDWIHEKKPDWNLLRHVPNRYPGKGNQRSGSLAEFYIYEKKEASSSIA